MICEKHGITRRQRWRNGKKDGWSVCWKCDYLQHRDRIIETVRDWQKRNPHSKREANRRQKALRRGAKRGFWVTKRDMRRLWHRQDRRCAYCRVTLALGEAQQDHVIPVRRGGVHSIGNIVLACGPCNASKSQKIPFAWYRERGFSPLSPERGRPAADLGRMAQIA